MTVGCRASVFIATSLDGFIARPDGSLDWLPGSDPNADDGHADTSVATYDGDYGYERFFTSVDALVMGRATYDAVLGFGQWPYGDKPVVVATHRPLDPPPDSSADVSTLAGSAHDLAAALGARGFAHVYLDGANLIQQFLVAGLVDRLIITRVPVVIGSGRALFAGLPDDINMRHVTTESFPNGFVQSTYDVEQPAG